MRTSAFVSLGKQLPPHPGPGLRNSLPIRLSDPIPSTTSATSAPTCSDRAAMALMNDSLVARKALAAYLISSAVAGSVTMNGAQEVLHRRALAEELRVGDDADI